jgi:3-keto-disaccharide hydrolase
MAIMEVRFYAALVTLCVALLGSTTTAQQPTFVSLFNGKDLSGWKIPEGDNGHWKVVDGVIDYDAQSEAKGDKSLWSEKSYADFILRVDWRIKETPYINPNVPIIRYDGTHKKDANGRELRLSVPDSDSGIYLRGDGKSQVNIWCWPIGSGEVYGYRMDEKMPAAVRAGVTPSKNADKDVGQWNTFEITMRGSRLTVVLNGQTVISNAELPGIAASGPIALQHHGSKKGDVWTGPPSLVQFRNISIAELSSAGSRR